MRSVLKNNHRMIQSSRLQNIVKKATKNQNDSRLNKIFEINEQDEAKQISEL